MVRKVVFVAKFRALSWQSPGVTEENKENLSQGKLEEVEVRTGRLPNTSQNRQAGASLLRRIPIVDLLSS
jgi:hypothetical protein